jgi:hypothetical protein
VNLPSEAKRDQIDEAREKAWDLQTHGWELRRQGQVEAVVGRRVLVQEGWHVHLLGAMEALDAVERPDLRAQAAHHEVLEDPRRRPHLSRRHRRSPASRVDGILSAAGESLPPLLSTVSALRVCRRGEGSVQTEAEGVVVAGGRRRGVAGRVVV